MQTEPVLLNPISAVTHRDPYPYYADLIARQPFYFDDALGCWVASSANAVRAVLTDEDCRVRPPSEPIPKSLLGSPAADLFGPLVRQNDGTLHQALKPPIRSTLAALDHADVLEQARRSARSLFESMRPDRHPHRLADFNFRLPVDIVGTLLGVPENYLNQTTVWVDAYVGALAPGANAQQVNRGKVAAGNLLDLFYALLLAGQENASAHLLTAFARQASDADNSAIVANAIGFLTQAYEATAGLIGNTILALAADPKLRQQASTDFALQPSIIAEVLRYDSPVQNTRRFSAKEHSLCGQMIHAGETILVILAAANRDPAANPNPHQFDRLRSSHQIFSFGIGAHACPGEQIALAITTAALETLLASHIDLDALAAKATYRLSANTRIPLFARPEGV